MSAEKFAKGEIPYFRSSEFNCKICNKEFSDPRVLPCLHCFCIECLRSLIFEQNLRAKPVKVSLDERFRGGCFSKKKSHQYEYVELDQFSNGNRSRRNDRSDLIKTEVDEFVPQTLTCPICGFENKLPPKGVQDLPPNYLLQHRMLVDSLNRGQICLLCDLCSPETPAVSRCTKCLLNLCDRCAKSHKREKLFPDHDLRKLKKNHREGIGITRIRRQVMCPAHVEKELRFFCSSCNMVACTECCVEYHSDHDCESFSSAAQTYAQRIKESLEKTRKMDKDAAAAIVRLDQLSRQIESKYSQVRKDVNSHIDSYLVAFEEHRKTLLNRAAEIRQLQIRNLKSGQREVEKKARDIGHTLKFGEELLSEGSDFEVLSFAFYLLQRLEWCIKSGTSALSSAFAGCTGNIHFLPDELAGSAGSRTVFGIVTTQLVSPPNCYITSEGLEGLKNCQENQRCDLLMVTNDSYGQRLVHGSEAVEVDLRCQNGSHRQKSICVVDQQNGIYLISFTPDVSGNMYLSVSIRGVPIKGSPFSVRVRSQRSQRETLPCCAFCSSEKKMKNSICGCGVKNPGGQGHGRSSHQGQCRWPCCGNALQKTGCLKSLGNGGFYQLSL